MPVRGSHEAQGERTDTVADATMAGTSGWERSMIRRVGRRGGFLAATRVLAAGAIAFVASAVVLASEARGIDSEQDATGVGGERSGWAQAHGEWKGAGMPLGVVPSDPATIAALRAFGLRVNQIHARQLARAEARDGLIARPSPEESRSETPSEDAPGLSGTPRLRLRGVLDRMSVSASWKVEQDSWRVGIRLRYARSVEFDPATQSYALIEAREITPTARFRIVAIGRSTRVVVRRTGYGMWEKALITPPSRWLFVDRPNRIEEAQRLAPGTAITLSNETKFFVGADRSTDVGALPLGIRAGPFASGEYFVRLERLAKSVETSGHREWIVSVGGLIPRGFESAMTLRTPDLLLGESARLVEAHWRSPRGVRFLLRAGPLDLAGNPKAADFLRAAMTGAALFRFSDARLLGANLAGTGPRSELGPDLLKRMEHFPNFKRVLAAASEDPGDIPYSESISRFTPRAHGEAGVGFWVLFYGLDFTSDWYAEESLLAPAGRPSSRIFSHPRHRRWDRGWLFFPRETQDLQMITVQDGQGEDLFTEVSLEIEDAHAHRRESRTYRAQILSFITRALAEKFPQRTEAGSPNGPRTIRGELPDLVRAPKEDERISIYLRIILGPRFHERLLIGAKDGKDQRDRITEWQRRISRTIRRRDDAIEELVRTYGVEDLFVSFRIALTPYARRKESPRPTTLYTGFFGDPHRIPSYRRLRDTFDAAGTIF